MPELKKLTKKLKRSAAMNQVFKAAYGRGKNPPPSDQTEADVTVPVELMTPKPVKRAKDPSKKWKDVFEFIDRCRVLGLERSPTAERDYVYARHIEEFEDTPTPGTSLALVKARLAYHLQYEGFKQAGELTSLSEEFLRNYRAAISLTTDLTKFSPSVRSSLEVLGMAEEPSAEKVEKRKARKERKKLEAGGTPAPSKPKGGTATSYIYDLLHENATAKLTDAALQKAVLDKFPDAESFQRLSNIKRMRRRYSKGRSKYGTPAVPSKDYTVAPTPSKKKKKKKK